MLAFIGKFAIFSNVYFSYIVFLIGSRNCSNPTKLGMEYSLCIACIACLGTKLVFVRKFVNFAIKEF